MIGAFKRLPFGLRLTLLIALACALRIAVLAATPTDLFFDEAQYWAWSAAPDFGYYSKPPLIGWVIGAVTALAGSIEPFVVRLPAPLFHGTAAAILGIWLHRAAPAAALWAAALYLAMPILTIGSWMISTDTIMVPFWVGAMALWWRHLERRDLTSAALAGACAGLAVMAKYAGIYFWVGMIAAALLRRDLRPAPRGVLVAFAAFSLMIAPNVVWNLQNGLITLGHTAENIDWVQEGNQARFNLAGLAEFLGSQLLVIGPVFFVIWLIAALGARAGRLRSYLAAFSIPVLAIVSVQAVLSKAFGNWAFAAYPAACGLVAIWIARRAAWRWLKLGLAVNIGLAAIVSALITWPGLAPNAAKRYLGRAALAKAVLAQADGTPVVARERQLLADLTYQAARSGYAGGVFAPAPQGTPRNYYEMTAPWSGGAAVFVTGGALHCTGQEVVPDAVVRPDNGAYGGREIGLYHLQDCVPDWR